MLVYLWTINLFSPFFSLCFSVDELLVAALCFQAESEVELDKILTPPLLLLLERPEVKSSST